jgi:hypothetical protein
MKSFILMLILYSFMQGLILSNALRAQKNAEDESCTIALNNLRSEVIRLRNEATVTPGFKGQSRVHLIHAPKKTTYIITECIEINVIKHQSIYYIVEDLLQSKIINIKRTKDRRRQCRLRNAT